MVIILLFKNCSIISAYDNLNLFFTAIQWDSVGKLQTSARIKFVCFLLDDKLSCIIIIIIIGFNWHNRSV